MFFWEMFRDYGHFIFCSVIDLSLENNWLTGSLIVTDKKLQVWENIEIETPVKLFLKDYLLEIFFFNF